MTAFGTPVSPKFSIYPHMYQFDWLGLAQTMQRSSPLRLVLQSGDMPFPIMPYLPIDVWERVIDFVDDFDEHNRLKCLSACCLVCRDWLPRARFYLF